MRYKLVLVSLVSAFVAAAGAQTRAPHNDSIRQSVGWPERADFSPLYPQTWWGFTAFGAKRYRFRI